MVKGCATGVLGNNRVDGTTQAKGSDDSTALSSVHKRANELSEKSNSKAVSKTTKKMLRQTSMWQVLDQTVSCSGVQ